MSEGVKGKPTQARPRPGHHANAKTHPQRTDAQTSPKKHKKDSVHVPSAAANLGWDAKASVQELKRAVEKQQQALGKISWGPTRSAHVAPNGGAYITDFTASSSTSDQLILQANLEERSGTLAPNNPWKAPPKGGWVTGDKVTPGQEKRTEYLNLDERRTELATDLRMLKGGVTPPELLKDPIVNLLAGERTLKNIPETQRVLLARTIQRVANKASIDPSLVLSVIKSESRFTFAIENKKTGAQGLMQLMPIAVKQVNINRQKLNPKAQPLKRAAVNSNPLLNIEYGVEYLKFLKNIFGGNDKLMLMAYNLGETKTRAWMKAHNLRIPPQLKAGNPSTPEYQNVQAAFDLQVKEALGPGPFTKKTAAGYAVLVLQDAQSISQKTKLA